MGPWLLLLFWIRGQLGPSPPPLPGALAVPLSCGLGGQVRLDSFLTGQDLTWPSVPS